MSSKPIGTMFVELDLDASRYTKGQQKLLKDAQSTTLNIEQNFKNLGIKSSAEMDLMRAKIKNSFDMIANSSKATANDILRAERAKNEQLEALNKKQFGSQDSLIENMKGKWVAAAAAIAGSIMAINKAVDMAAVGSKLEKQSAAFENLAASAGTSSVKMLESLRKASQGMIAEADLIGAAGKAMLMNINPAEISKLMEIAAATSKSTGQTITEAFNDITLGVARQSKMILDNLGIIVDVDRANQDYAKSLGKAADALTDAEKRQAFMNSVMKSGEDMIKRIGASTGSLDNVNKLVAAQTNLWNEVTKTVASLLDKELGGYVSVINWIDAKLKSMRGAAGEATKTDMAKEIEMLRSLEAKGMAQPGSTMAKMAEYNRRFGGGRSEAELSAEKSFSEWQKPDQYASWREREGNYADYTEEEKKAMIAARDKALKDIAAAKPAKSIWEGWGVRPYTESEAFLADEKAWENYKKMWSDYKPRLAESQQSEAMLADQKVFEDWKKKTEDTFNYMTELSERTAERMQDNFSNLFYDAMRGELKSFEDYATAVFDSIQRAAADMAGQMATQAIFGAKSTGGTSGGGGLVGWLASLVGTTAASQMHSGGMVDGSGPHRQVPAWMIATAPRLHNGLAPDEFPAVLQRGERVVSKKEASMPATNITIHVAAPQGRIERQSLTQMQTALFSTLQRAGRRNA